MYKLFAALIGLSILAASGCVGAKVYRKEKKTRIAAETREKVLVEELLYRKNETKSLTQTVGDLNRNIGRQEVKIKDLQTELTARTQSMGASASKLSSEKSKLEKTLTLAQEDLARRKAVLKRIKAVQDKRKSILLDLEKSLKNAFEAKMSTGITIVVRGEMMSLTFPDKALFGSSGLSVSDAGLEALQPLAEYLSARPGLDVDILAYTDNVLPPKSKRLIDTWDWSLQRATNVVRLLIREYNVNANQLTPIGRGEFYPLTSNETEEGRSKNRRTVVLFRPQLPGIPAVD